MERNYIQDLATQSTLKAKADGAASSGTNSGALDVSNHMTWYIQPGAMITDNTMLYLSYGVNISRY